MSTAASNKKTKGNSASAAHDCAHCGAEEGPKKHLHCSRCKITFYCSKDCQTIHWKKGGHKKFCVDPSKRTLASNTVGSDAAAAVTTPAASGDGGGDECPICLDPLASSPTRKLQCGHSFHVTCVLNVRRYGLSQCCALCRSVDSGADGGTTGGGGTGGGGDLEERYEETMRRFFAITGRAKTGTQVHAREVSEVQAALAALATDGTFSSSLNASTALGVLHYSLGNVTESLKWSRGPAEAGHVLSQTNLGTALLSIGGSETDSCGKSVLPPAGGTASGTKAQKKALTEAAKWFTKAANQGDSYAQQALGAMCGSGHGVPLNCAEAAKWRRLAAEQGDDGSCFALGNLYEEGSEDGRVPLSFPDALKWYLEGARLGNKDCAFNGSVFLRKGRGAGKLSDGSEGPLKAGLAQRPDHVAALPLCLQAAEAGHASAQHSMGLTYENGMGVAADACAAARWYLKAANQCHAKALYQYGVCCFTGKGVEQDDDRAQSFMGAALAALEDLAPEERAPGLADSATKLIIQIEKKKIAFAKLTPEQKKMVRKYKMGK